MTENVDNLIVEHLKGLRNQIEGLQSEMRAQFKDVKQRLQSLESSTLSIRRENLHTEEDVARQQVIIDQITERLNRIEKRLDLS